MRCVVSCGSTSFPWLVVFFVVDTHVKIHLLSLIFDGWDRWLMQKHCLGSMMIVVLGSWFRSLLVTTLGTLLRAGEKSTKEGTGAKRGNSPQNARRQRSTKKVLYSSIQRVLSCKKHMNMGRELQALITETRCCLIRLCHQKWPEERQE